MNWWQQKQNVFIILGIIYLVFTILYFQGLQARHICEILLGWEEAVIVLWGNINISFNHSIKHQLSEVWNIKTGTQSAMRIHGLVKRDAKRSEKDMINKCSYTHNVLLMKVGHCILYSKIFLQCVRRAQRF